MGEQVFLDPGQMVDFLAKSTLQSETMEHRLVRAKAQRVNIKTVSYEDVTTQPKSLKSVISFLLQDVQCPAGVAPDSSVQSEALQSQQMRTGSLSDLISNWRQVKETLQGTQYGHMLELSH